ncbi:retroviral-like aspartic protease family protein [Altererythrobacter sp.]|uniref:retroviral-like aspartic protease family protein n=1 Tax=Altererythrobacter sp. TaxID=1872480 RepID=UPI0025BB828A|nr:retroviral-like aspartic protease family protein [Altererythrobacter sp.]
MMMYQLLWSILASAGLLSAAVPMTQAVEQQQKRTPIPTSPLLPDLTDPETTILSLDEDSNLRYTIPVRIDGVGPYNFMIDTGSQATAVTDRVMRGVILPPAGEALVVGMASRQVVDLVELDRFEVADRTLHNIAAPVLQRRHVGADGIIGLDALQDFRVLIDFRDETIAVADAEDELSRRGFEIVVRARSKLGQLLITDAKIEGVRATVIIDTGAQASMGNLALQRRIRAKRAHEVKTTDVNGASILSDLSYARSLEFQGLEVSNVPITFADTPAFEALGLQDKPVLSLGMQHLRLFDRVAIDFAKRQILFDLPRRARIRYEGNHATRLD